MDERPKSVEQYVELVRQAVFEVEELRASVEYDTEYMGGAVEFLDGLESGVRELYRSMREGRYRFEDRDLPFMRMVDKHDDRLLPFKRLLHTINATHRKGLALDEDDGAPN